jgi:hypothetical protein
VALIMLAGCVHGDFGRTRRSLIGEGTHDWIGNEAVGSVDLPASAYPLTDEERLLRSQAYPLIAPPYDRDRWTAVLAERGLLRWGPDDGVWTESEYLRRITAQPSRSPVSRYSRLIDDVRNDLVRVDAFFGTAFRVADLDSKRERSLNYVSGLTVGESENATNRINENGLIIEWVCRSLAARATAYRYALERLVISVPSPKAVEAERALTLLQAKAAVCDGPLLRSAAGPLISK